MFHSTLKRCGLCMVTKPAGDFNRSSRLPDGLQGRCRDCQKATKTAWRQANLERVRDYQRDYRQSRPVLAARRPRGPLTERRCSDCGQVKPIDRFRKKRANGTVRACYCKPCANRRSTEWRRNNVDPERRLNERAKDAARKARSYALDPSGYRVRNAVRRARISGATTAPFTKEMLTARLDYFGHRCWMCGGDYEHLDHVKPISRGGPHMLANLRPACARCNLSKKDRWFGVEGLSRLIA